MRPATADGGAQHGAAIEKISTATKQLDRPQRTETPAGVVDLDRARAHRAQRRALDHLDAAGACAWTAPRSCPSRQGWPA